MGTVASLVPDLCLDIGVSGVVRSDRLLCPLRVILVPSLVQLVPSRAGVRHTQKSLFENGVDRCATPSVEMT